MADTSKRGGRGGMRNPRHPKRIAATLRHGDWVELYLQGLGATEIAERYGVAKSTVSEAVTSFLRQHKSAEAEELRAKWLARHEHNVGKLWRHLDSEDPGVVFNATAALVKLSKRTSEITGMDRPSQAPVGPDGKPVIPQINVHYHEEPVRE